MDWRETHIYQIYLIILRPYQLQQSFHMQICIISDTFVSAVKKGQPGALGQWEQDNFFALK